MKIDLKQKNDVESCAPMQDKKQDFYYPTMYLSNLEGSNDFKTGQKVLIRGVIKSVTMTDRDGKKTYSCDIEGRELLSDGKQEAMDKNKADEKAVDEGIDEAMKEYE